LSHEDVRHVIQSGDLESLIQDWMEAYGDDVWRYACFITKRRDAADDITQDVFWKAYRHRFAFRGECSVKTWLLGITRRTAINYLRSAFVRKVTLFGLFSPQGTSRSAESVMMDRQAERSLWETVLGLPAKYREVLVLDAHYELSNNEIAELLDLSEGTVKSRLHRARAKVERKLKEEEPR
jgi:RNA polymerase sigma-70 factor (ECF subfamily)